MEGSKNVRTGKWGLENSFHGVRTDKSQLQDGHSLQTEALIVFVKNVHFPEFIDLLTRSINFLFDSPTTRALAFI